MIDLILFMNVVTNYLKASAYIHPSSFPLVLYPPVSSPAPAHPQHLVRTGLLFAQGLGYWLVCPKATIMVRCVLPPQTMERLPV